MSRKSKGLVAAAAAFAASPQGQRFIRQIKDYASKPENRAKLQRMMDQAKAKKRGTSSTGTSGGTTYPQ